MYILRMSSWIHSNHIVIDFMFYFPIISLWIKTKHMLYVFKIELKAGKVLNLCRKLYFNWK